MGREDDCVFTIASNKIYKIQQNVLLTDFNMINREMCVSDTYSLHTTNYDHIKFKLNLTGLSRCRKDKMSLVKSHII